MFKIKRRESSKTMFWNERKIEENFVKTKKDFVRTEKDLRRNKNEKLIRKQVNKKKYFGSWRCYRKKM